MGKYLVTGGCGFIGSHLVEALVHEGHQVRVIDDLSTGKKDNIPDQVELIEASILDRLALQKAINGVEGCFHLAAIASVEKSTKEWSKTHEVNQTGIVYLFEEIAKLPRPIFVIYASSASVYGNCSRFPLKEAEKLNPISAYGVDKLACELQAFVAYHHYKIPTTGLRFFNVYGPRQDPTSPYSGVITKFLNKISQNSPIEIYGDGTQQRDFIHVDDVVSCLLRVLEEPSSAEVYNVCTGHSFSISQLASFLEEILDKKIAIQHLAAKPGDPLLSLGDPSKMQEAYQFAAKISLKEGLASLIHAKK